MKVCWGLCAIVGMISAVSSFGAEPAQYWGPSQRAGRMEVFLEGSLYTKGSSDSDIAGTSGSLDLASSGTGGLGLGVNFGPYVNLNGDFSGGPAKITVNQGFPSRTFDDVTLLSGVGHLDIYPINGPLTPVISGGAGIVHTHSSEGDTGETDLTYDVGGGVRWDINKQFMLKALYRARWISFKDTQNDMLQHTFWLQAGFKF